MLEHSFTERSHSNGDAIRLFKNIKTSGTGRIIADGNDFSETEKYHEVNDRHLMIVLFEAPNLRPCYLKVSGKISV